LLIRPDEIPNHGCLTARAYCSSTHQEMPAGCAVCCSAGGEVRLPPPPGNAAPKQGARVCPLCGASWEPSRLAILLSYKSSAILRYQAGTPRRTQRRAKDNAQPRWPLRCQPTGSTDLYPAAHRTSRRRRPTARWNSFAASKSCEAHGPPSSPGEVTRLSACSGTLHG
jgi:hypothetical protein